MLPWIKDLKILAKIAEIGPKILSVIGWFTGTTLGAALLGIGTPLLLLALLAKGEKEDIEKLQYGKMVSFFEDIDCPICSEEQRIEICLKLDKE